jgi:hypothetical protein
LLAARRGTDRVKAPDTVSGVPLVAAAICPNPPLILPELAAGAATELDDLRAACDTAIARLWTAGPDLVTVVAAGDAPAPDAPPSDEPPTGELLARFGARGTAGGRRPLGVLIGLWLLERQPAAVPVAVRTVPAGAAPRDCAALGRQLTAANRVALLVMGDGSACHGLQSPGYEDSRADGFDGAVRAALAAGDPAGLLALDPGLADEVLAAGRAPWQVLAGAADGRRWHAEVDYDKAPYGVGYFVASWT